MDPTKTAASRTGPRTSSAVSSTCSTWEGPARSWAATSQPPWSGVASMR